MRKLLRERERERERDVILKLFLSILLAMGECFIKTKKSIQARQHQFFEQRRQQLRSQAAEELIADKFSKPQGNIYSLDIASLKNLSQLTQQHGNDQFEGIKSSFCVPKPVCAEDFRKTQPFEGDAGICQTNECHCTGYPQPETTLNAAEHFRATVGTQWTPASAAAAATLSHYETGLCPQEPPSIPAKDLHAKIEDSKREERPSNVQANPEKNPKVQPNPNQEKNAKNNLGQKILSRHKFFEKFQILDLINGSHDGVKRKKDSHAEHYAAYALEGMGRVPNCTPKNDNAGCKKTRNKDQLPDRKYKHGTQRLPLEDPARRKKGKVHLQKHSLSSMDEDCDAVTSLESFADSNGEQCSGECDLRRDQSPVEMNTRTRLRHVDRHLDHSFSRALFNERNILGLDYIARLPSPAYNTGSSYPKLYESPELAGFTLEKNSLFSICSDYGSTNISFEMDDYNSHDYLENDDDLRDVYSSPESGGTRIYEFRDCTNGTLLMDDSVSPDALPPSLFGKAAHDFTFNSPAAEMFSESTFEFKGASLESGVFKTEFESPSLWEKKLNATYGNAKDSEAASFCLKRTPGVKLSPLNSLDDNEFIFASVPHQEETEISAMRLGHLTENNGFICDKLIETESSSLDTFFGTNISDFPLSPTSPLLNQSCHVKSSHGAEILLDCSDNSFVQNHATSV